MLNLFAWCWTHLLNNGLILFNAGLICLSLELFVQHWFCLFDAAYSQLTLNLFDAGLFGHVYASPLSLPFFLKIFWHWTCLPLESFDTGLVFAFTSFCLLLVKSWTHLMPDLFEAVQKGAVFVWCWTYLMLPWTHASWKMQLVCHFLSLLSWLIWSSSPLLPLANATHLSIFHSPLPLLWCELFATYSLLQFPSIDATHLLLPFLVVAI